MKRKEEKKGEGKVGRQVLWAVGCYLNEISACIG